MTNIIAHGDRFKLNLWLWTNAAIPAKAWFEIACAKHEYGDFHMPTVTNEHFQTRHVGVDEHGRARVRVACTTDWTNDFAIPITTATCRCNAVVEPFGFPRPVFRYKDEPVIFASSNFPTVGFRIIPLGEPIARSDKYPVLAVIYQVEKVG